MNEEKLPAKPPKVWPQWLAALTIHILSNLVGLVSGWTSPYLAKLTEGKEQITMTPDQASWTAALISVTRPFGAVIAAIMVAKLGAKKAVLFNGIPHALAWSCFLINQSVPWIYASRLLSGLGLGMFYSTFPLYIGEISNPNIRGALISLITQGMSIGTLLGNLIGAYVDMTMFAVISLVMTTSFFFLFIVFPDSPHHLIKENRFNEAERSLMWYNRRKDVSAELESLKSFTGQQTDMSFTKRFCLLFKKEHLKTVFMVNLVYIFMQLSGLYTISLYMEMILKSLKVEAVEPSLVVVGVGLVGLIAGVASMYTNDHFGRRSMLATSSFGITVSLFLLGLNYLLLQWGWDSSYLQYLSIVTIVMYQVFVCLGIMPVPSCLMSEMFPPQLKEMGTCLANITSAFFAFVTSKSYQPLLDATSEVFVFWFYAVLMLGMFVYTVIYLPETKGKTLQEIQEMLKRDRQKTTVPKSTEKNEKFGSINAES